MKLPRDISGSELKAALQRLGFATVRQTGSHVRMVKQNIHLTVPMHNSLAPGTLQSILRQAKITADELLDLL